MEFRIEKLKNNEERARQFIFSNGARILQSYDTLVIAEKNGKLYRLWDGYSRTTQKHIAEFVGSFVSKSELKKLETISLARLVGHKMASTLQFGLYLASSCKYSDICCTQNLF